MEKKTIRKKVLRMSRSVVCAALAAAVILSGVQIPGIRGTAEVVMAATVSGKVPIVCYPTGSGKVTTYTSSSLSKRTGWIGSWDKCTIKRLYSNGAVQVTYPVDSGGTRTAYARCSAFFGNENWSTATGQFGVKKTAYAKSTGSTAIGTVYAKDSICIIARANNRTQVLYPTSSGYKLGWVAGSYKIDDGSSDSTGSNGSPVSVSSGIYHITSGLSSSKAMDVNGNGTSNGTNIQLYDGASTNQAQRFQITSVGSGYYKIIHVYSGKAIDVAGAEAKSGANVQLYTYNGSSAQLWRFFSAGNGYYYIQNKLGYYLDVSEAKTANGTNIQVYSYNATDAQKWELTSVSSVTAGTTTDKAQEMVNKAISQIGVADSKGDNNVIYNTWYYGKTVKGSGYAWCMAFQSWCADQVGVLNTAIPKKASCGSAVTWFKNRGQFYKSSYYGGSYTPKTGDLVFYTNNGSTAKHVGIIIGSCVNGYLQVVEGNVYDSSTGNYKVAKFTKNSKRKLSSSYVLGYAAPSY